MPKECPLPRPWKSLLESSWSWPQTSHRTTIQRSCTKCTSSTLRCFSQEFGLLPNYSWTKKPLIKSRSREAVSKRTCWNTWTRALYQISWVESAKFLWESQTDLGPKNGRKISDLLVTYFLARVFKPVTSFWPNLKPLISGKSLSHNKASSFVLLSKRGPNLAFQFNLTYCVC